MGILISSFKIYALTAIKFYGPNNKMEVRGTSGFKSGMNMSGIWVESGATLTISGYGEVTAIGGDYGAGIGGRIQQHCGNINITDATVIARGGVGAAGIGGGGGRIGFPEFGIPAVPGGNGGTVNISGIAWVYANGSQDIGRGVAAVGTVGTLNISGDAAVFLGNNNAPAASTSTHIHEPGVKLAGPNLSGAITSYGLTGAQASWESATGGYFPTPSFNINIVAGSNGGVSPSGSRTITYMHNLTISLAPSNNYHVDSVTPTMGSSIVKNNNTTYTIQSISRDDTINCSFKLNTITFIDPAPTMNIGVVADLSKAFPYDITPAYATNTDIVWESSDASVAAIDNSSGMITDKNVGNTTITIRTNDMDSIVLDTCSLTVVNNTPVNEKVKNPETGESSPIRVSYFLLMLFAIVICFQILMLKKKT